MFVDIFGFPPQVLFGQLLLGLINGAFYAVLSLGLAVIFGLLNIVNFAHGALYMLGAFVAYFLLTYGGIGYWGALIIAPIVVGGFGALIERVLLRRLAGVDHLYGLLLTFGLALILEGTFVKFFGASGKPYPTPAGADRRGEPRLHVPALVPRLGGRRLARGLLRNLASVRAHQDRRLSPGRDREPQALAGFRGERAVPDHARLRLRRRARGLCRRARGADHPGRAADGVATSSSSSSRWW